MIRLATILSVFGLFVALTYVWPLLHDLRPWIPGEKIPGSRLVEMWSDPAPTSAATIFGWASVSTGGEEAVKESIRKDLGHEIAANLGPEAGVDEPVFTGATSTPGYGESGGTPLASVVISDAELEGLPRPIELPSPDSMDAFWAALTATARGKAGQVTRIAHYGDSTIATDGVTSTVRRRLQQRFGDSGHGFVLVAKGFMPYAHKDVDHWGSDDWKLGRVTHADFGRGGRYGYGGVTYRSYGGAKARFGAADEKSVVGHSVSRFELIYEAHENGGDLGFSVDGGEERRLSTRSEETKDAWYTVEAGDGAHTLRVRAAGGGQVRLHGVVLERSVPGVVYDSLGMVGARARRLLNGDAKHWASQIAHRSPDLLILAFGGNEADDKWKSAAWYEESLTQVVRTMRAGKSDMPCLLLAPLDQGERVRGQIRTIPALPKLVASQRAVAMREGCAFFDTFQAMGGDGAMGRWNKTTPKLGGSDGRHATPAGYQVIGNMFYKALLKGFQDYLSRTAL